VEEKMGLIAIHDGVRPFTTTKFVERLFKEAEINGNAIPFTNSTNSLRKIEGNKNFSVDRSLYVQIQTPQVFKYNDIIKCLETSAEDDYNDEASLIESFGHKINLVLGEEGNIKITNKEDLKYFN
ncbi:MAG: 2-C-methyl-D-erythritol 4-phosphate cytidylyltransferase, partial [Bacteroidota bacterium]|nr:2-C-methyl-D-erythritol 4-phosphate cytidylyltransferase [Bacteroidota bacterium]